MIVFSCGFAIISCTLLGSRCAVDGDGVETAISWIAVDSNSPEAVGAVERAVTRCMSSLAGEGDEEDEAIIS
jgi:hypothetical protein